MNVGSPPTGSVVIDAIERPQRSGLDFNMGNSTGAMTSVSMYSTDVGKAGFKVRVISLATHLSYSSILNELLVITWA